jgi:hypothetical protein
MDDVDLLSDEQIADYAGGEGMLEFLIGAPTIRTLTHETGEQIDSRVNLGYAAHDAVALYVSGRISKEQLIEALDAVQIQVAQGLSFELQEIAKAQRSTQH